MGGRRPLDWLRRAPQDRSQSRQRERPDLIPDMWRTENEFGMRYDPEDHKYAGNLRLDKYWVPDDIKVAMADIAEQHDNFEGARRGTLTLGEQEEMADMLGMTVEDLLKWRRGQAFSAAEAIAARNILTASAIEVKRLAVKVDGYFDEAGEYVGPNDKDYVDFHTAIERHVAIQEVVSGMTAEAGRALGSFRVVAEARDAELLKNVMSSGAVDRKRMGMLAATIADPSITDTSSISRIAPQLREATTFDKFLEIWINWGLLSGPVTHMVNFGGNAAIASTRTIFEKPLTAMLSLKRGRKGIDRVLFRELAAELYGISVGMKEGMKLGVKAALTETPSEFAGKIDLRTNRAIKNRFWGRVARAPGMLLLFGDEFWKAIARRQELHSLAYREAYNEGYNIYLRPFQYNRRSNQIVKEIMAGTHPNAIEYTKRAERRAQYQTFTNPLNPEVGGLWQRLTNNLPALRLVTPFIRTPMNILKYSGERTVFALKDMGFANEQVQQRLAGELGEEMQDEQIARIMFGSIVSAGAITMAMNGEITGHGPTDPRERYWWLREFQPYSIRIGDTWYSYHRFEPISTIGAVTVDTHVDSLLTYGMNVLETAGEDGMAAAWLAMVADLVETADYYADDEEALGNAIGLIMGSASKNVTNKTFLEGLSQMLEAQSDPDRYMRAYLSRFASTALVPNLSAQYTRSEDPYVRDARNFVDQVKRRISPSTAETLRENVPFMQWVGEGSRDLGMRVDGWGRPLTYSSLGPEWISPIFTFKPANDPLTHMLLNIRVFPGPPPRKLGRVQLEGKEYEFYATYAGQTAHALLTRIIQAPLWEILPNHTNPFVENQATKEGIVRMVFSYSREIAAKALAQNLGVSRLSKIDDVKSEEDLTRLIEEMTRQEKIEAREFFRDIMRMQDLSPEVRAQLEDLIRRLE